jgi:protein phosphatase
MHEPALTGIATTFTGVFSDGMSIRVGHSGDSQGYRLRDGQLQQVARDDSFVQDLIDADNLTAEAARARIHSGLW